jgi:pumilio family protein 6
LEPLLTSSAEPGQTSREAHAKQKQLALERKAAKPLADEVAQAKKIWERLRLKTNISKDERRQLVDELFSIIKGRMREFVLKHDTVRAVQTAIKYSTAAQRREIASELKGVYVQLAESRYAKFLIGKLMVQDDAEIRDMIIPEFYGKVRKLINHPEASWILDDIYRSVATKEQKAMLLREWYGPEFAIQGMADKADPTADLKQILESEPSKRGPIMKSLFDMANSLVQKSMTGFTMLHDAMLQYFLNTPRDSTEFTAFVELVKGDESGDLMKNLAFTKSGARLVCLLLAYGTAKDRKQLLKAYKDTLQMMASDPLAQLVILTAYDVIDDTKLSSKTIFSELLGDGEEEVAGNVVTTVNNLVARRTILYLFEGMSKPLFPNSSDFAVEVLNEAREIRQTTSKKDPDARRKELIAAVSPHLIKVIAAAPQDLVSTMLGTQFVAHVLFSCEGDKQKALEAVAESAGGDPTQEPEQFEDGTSSIHISQTPFGGRMLKSLIQGGHYDKAAGKIIPTEPPLHFADILYPVIKDYIMEWATGPGSFVVVALVESGDFSKGEELKKTLKKNKGLLEKAAASEEQNGGEKRQKSGKKGKPKAPVGNVGSKILLGAL